MPELPEVETTMRGIEPYVCGQVIKRFIVRDNRLRWPVASETASLPGHRIENLSRRGKYILMQLDCGTLIWHLGMSGSMKIRPAGSPIESHEHIEVELASGYALKFRDPRRFGALLYTESDPLTHPLLEKLGPEPLSAAFDGKYLYSACRKRSAAIKSVIMDSRRVAGVGNIYASEALFSAGINPARAAGRISKKRLDRLVIAIKETLQAAILQGGTTLKDFTQVDGNPGYFGHRLNVYGVKGPCPVCGKPVKQSRQGQRSTYFCPQCQT
ncbi:MAG: bifunctional DNA-formamidopyrimidine glycosylase/DNA-(apurinic or apyrimidinic site) lyase [Gammaproteobacteria bacterium]|nr:bifunctional DNA-formamidopyrimidine glycosylase/DNA-(apurinic or apyrimidinic site) lyase [Gammaproteobacteria bacterium]MCZ6723303.1 bifunctional DNA-formamidopyrimidine glycosylase/DNA-(apurinic or apyrimidinic site) lyase [Gammaproteobacteria bacterium]